MDSFLFYLVKYHIDISYNVVFHEDDLIKT